MRKDGTRVEVAITLSPIRDAGGRVVGASAIARDVTERKRLERMQEDFLAMASHDLRTPATVIQARAQLMKRRRAYDETGVLAILEQTRRMERLIADLGEVVRLEAGRVELRTGPVDLGALAREAAGRAQSQAAAHAIRLEAPRTPVVGCWDRDRLAQVLDNLLGNAVKYAPGGSQVVVRVERVAGEARLAVADRGPGIAPEHLPRLFERFYRADGTGAAAGLGLGLYISRMLVEAHGGRIWAASAPGEGSTFTVALPLEQGAAG